MEQMHPSFPDWYRAAKLKPDGDLMAKRWAAVNSFDPKRPDVLDLARVFFGFGNPSDSFLSSFRSAFQKKDPAFPASDNSVEMQVLAGAELVDSWNSYSAPWSSYAALVVVCGSCRGLRLPKVPAIVELAVQKFGECCVERFDATKLAKPADLSAEARTAVKTSCEQGALPQLAEPLVALMQEVARLRTAQANYAQRLELQAEETNMLWWMLGEHGRDEEKHFSKLTPTAACLTVGKDLSDLVTVVPGPLGARAFLDRALRLTKAKPEASIRIKEAVNSIAREQREQWLSSGRWNDALADLCPLHRALKLSLESSKKDAWLPSFEQGSHMAQDALLSARELAYQMYLEGVLNQAWCGIGAKG